MLSMLRLSRKDIDLTGKILMALQSWFSGLEYSLQDDWLGLTLGFVSSLPELNRLLIRFSALAMAVMAVNFLSRVYL